MSLDIFNGFLRRKDNAGSSYNYDLNAVINNFSFFDFCSSVKDTSTDNGGILVITGKQYILGYTAGFGKGTHVGACARIYTDLHGGGRLSGERDVDYAYKLCMRECLIARITYETSIDDENRRSTFAGNINFTVADYFNARNKVISEGMFLAFEKFYADYNKEIEFVTKRFNFKVIFYYYDENGRVAIDTSKNLDNLYNLLKKIVNRDVQETSDEEIIGVPVNNNRTK